jgi:hypothetical protein
MLELVVPLTNVKLGSEDTADIDALEPTVAQLGQMAPEADEASNHCVAKEN